MACLEFRRFLLSDDLTPHRQTGRPLASNSDRPAGINRQIATATENADSATPKPCRRVRTEANQARTARNSGLLPHPARQRADRFRSASLAGCLRWRAECNRTGIEPHRIARAFLLTQPIVARAATGFRHLRRPGHCHAVTGPRAGSARGNGIAGSPGSRRMLARLISGPVAQCRCRPGCRS